jgi:prepilin-type N-terminal cleavage/methylation domain-containing protein/prepilin-type processing-associated H-X9-DG protein
MKSPARRAGYSLVELLVTAAIMAVLLALALGGIQKVRATLGRIWCQNNLRQIAIAVHTYEGTNGTFPQGTASATLSGDEKAAEHYPGMSWMGAILQDVGEDVVWQRAQSAFDKDQYIYDAPPHPGDYILKRYCCPGDHRTLQVQYVGGFTVALTSYLGVNGTNVKARDGIFFSRSKVTSTELLAGAGLSNTLMVGERPPSSDLYYGWWYHGAGQYDYSADPRDLNSGSLDVVLGAAEINLHTPSKTAGASCGDGPFRYGPGKLDRIEDQFHFWSLHGGGSNFAFADGSVHFIPYSAAALLPKLATRGPRTELVPINF